VRFSREPNLVRVVISHENHAIFYTYDRGGRIQVDLELPYSQDFQYSFEKYYTVLSYTPYRNLADARDRINKGEISEEEISAVGPQAHDHHLTPQGVIKFVQRHGMDAAFTDNVVGLTPRIDGRILIPYQNLFFVYRFVRISDVGFGDLELFTHVMDRDFDDALESALNVLPEKYPGHYTLMQTLILSQDIGRSRIEIQYLLRLGLLPPIDSSGISITWYKFATEQLAKYFHNNFVQLGVSSIVGDDLDYLLEQVLQNRKYDHYTQLASNLGFEFIDLVEDPYAKHYIESSTLTTKAIYFYLAQLARLSRTQNITHDEFVTIMELLLKADNHPGAKEERTRLFWTYLGRSDLPLEISLDADTIVELGEMMKKSK
jgi:hypothetical protein